jgi:exportin-7
LDLKKKYVFFSITICFFQIYSKLSQTYYGLLETLTADHMSFISMLEPQVFLYILSTISDGLGSLDSIISTSCCSALDHIITYLFKNLTKQKRSQQQVQQQQQQVGQAQQPGQDQQQAQQTPLVRVYQQQPQVFQQLLTTVINIIVFEDCKNQWSMSRPLLGLILLNEQVSCCSLMTSSLF